MTTGLILLAAEAAGAEAVPALTLDGPIKFADGSMLESAPATGFTSVHATGFQGCWDEIGNPIPCSGTGQDGELQLGADWPEPRFTPNNDGTVLDNLTGLIWLQDANCFGSNTWAQALTLANELMAGQCGLDDNSVPMDWRLPNLRELMSLIDYREVEPALPLGHPFINVQNAWYWSSTGGAEDRGNAWGVGIDAGNTDNGIKSYSQFVWPVRDPAE